MHCTPDAHRSPAPAAPLVQTVAAPLTLTPWRQAANQVMPLGKFRGQTLDAIASSDDGLRYLDWMRGEVDGQRLRISDGGALQKHLGMYLDDPTIAQDLDRALASTRRS